MNNNLYDTLEVNRDSDTDTIKKAYRSKARDTHPDHNKGKEEEFIKVHHAYLILSDPASRKRYDETGDDRQQTENSILAESASLIQGFFQTTLNQLSDTDIFYIDIIFEIRASLNRMVQEHKKTIQLARAKKAVVQKLMLKFKNKGNQRIVENILNDRIQTINSSIDTNERAIKVCNKALEILKDYSFETETLKQSPAYSFSFGTRTTGSW